MGLHHGFDAFGCRFGIAGLEFHRREVGARQMLNLGRDGIGWRQGRYPCTGYQDLPRYERD